MIVVIIGFLFLLFGFGCFVYGLYLLTNPKGREQIKFEKSVDRMVSKIIN